MADFDFVLELVAKTGADFGDDAETTDTGGFIDEDDLVFGYGIVSKHGIIIAY